MERTPTESCLSGLNKLKTESIQGKTHEVKYDNKAQHSERLKELYGEFLQDFLHGKGQILSDI